MLFIILGAIMLIASGIMVINGLVIEEERGKRVGYVIGGIVGLAIAAFSFYEGISEIVDFFGDDSSPDYETTYQDDNGNGTLDPGEWNYTVDEDGNVVDIDDDGSNFE